MMTLEMAFRTLGQVGVNVGEKLVQLGQGTAPMDIGGCDDTVDAANAGKKGSGRGSPQPRKQVKFDPQYWRETPRRRPGQEGH